MLCEMAHKGLILESTAPNGEKEYSVLPFEPGIVEILFSKGEDDERARRMARHAKNIDEEEGAAFDVALKDPETVRNLSSEPGVRIVSIEENIPMGKQVASWDKVTSIIERNSSYAGFECSCRHIAKLCGDPCKVEDAPSNCCIMFGPIADYMVEHNYAKSFAKETLYDHLKRCVDAGLVHVVTANIAAHEDVFMCNCCKCCCSLLINHEKVLSAGGSLLLPTNFAVQVNEEACEGCEECIDYCQASALKLSDDKIAVDRVRCLGCGSCTSNCPTESLSLIHRHEITGEQESSTIFQ